MSTHSIVEEVKLEFPYDLNNLFHLTYTFDILKNSIEFLARTQQAHSKMLEHLSHSNDQAHEQPTQIKPSYGEVVQKTSNDTPNQATSSMNNSQSQEVLSKDTAKALRDHDNILKNLRQEVNQLKDKTDNQDKQLNLQTKNFETYKTATDHILKELQERLKENENKTNEANSSIILLKTLSFQSNGDSDNGESQKGIIDALQTLIENLRKECYSKFGERDEQNLHRRKFEDVMERLRILDEKAHNNENSIVQCRDITDTNKLDIDDLKKFMKELKNKPAAPSNNNNNSSNDSNQSQLNKSALDELMKKIQQLEAQMQNKLDCDIYDNEIAGLRAMIGNLEGDDKKPQIIQVAPSAASSLSSKEINKLKEMIERFPQIEETLNKVLKDMKNMNIQALRDSIESITKQLLLFASKDDFKNLEGLIKALQQKTDKQQVDILTLQDLVNSLKNTIQNLPTPSASGPQTNEILLLRSRMEYFESAISQQKKISIDLKKSLDDYIDANGKSKQGADESRVKDLETMLGAFKLEFLKFKDETHNNLQSLADSLSKKADKEELAELEQRLMEKMSEMLKKLLNTFADKNDTKKRLTTLEKNVKSLFELLMAKGSPSRQNGNEEDAMFTKKPLGGMSCASCERNITNLSGQMADFQAWKKLPFRETNDRIARYGPGFSKMLSMLKPDQQSESSRLEQFGYRKQTIEPDGGVGQHLNLSGIQDHTITVEMPTGISQKSSARTGHQFYKNNTGIISGKNSAIRGGGFGIQEESPPRSFALDNSNEALPFLNVKRGSQ